MRETVLKVDATHEFSWRQELREFVHIGKLHRRVGRCLIRVIPAIGPIMDSSNFLPPRDQLRRAHSQVRKGAVSFILVDCAQRRQPAQFRRSYLRLISGRWVILQLRRRGYRAQFQFNSAKPVFRH